MPLIKGYMFVNGTDLPSQWEKSYSALKEENIPEPNFCGKLGQEYEARRPASSHSYSCVHIKTITLIKHSASVL